MKDHHARSKVIRSAVNIYGMDMVNSAVAITPCSIISNAKMGVTWAKPAQKTQKQKLKFHLYPRNPVHINPNGSCELQISHPNPWYHSAWCNIFPLKHDFKIVSASHLLWTPKHSTSICAELCRKVFKEVEADDSVLWGWFNYKPLLRSHKCLEPLGYRCACSG